MDKDLKEISDGIFKRYDNLFRRLADYEKKEKEMADKEKFIQCDCYGEGLLITKFDDEEELYFSYWRQGIDPVKLTWWMRIKVCWLAIVKGNYYEDQIVLNKSKAKELADWINHHCK